MASRAKTEQKDVLGGMSDWFGSTKMGEEAKSRQAYERGAKKLRLG